MDPTQLPSGLWLPQTRTALGPPPDPQSLPPRSDMTPNANPPVGTVGPAPTADNAGVGAQHVMYPADYPPLEASAWAGWPSEWATPNTWSQGRAQWVSELDIVFACIDLNARIVADMPVFVTKGMQRKTSPPWVANPQPERYSHWGEFMRQVWWAYQAIGEAFILCTSRYEDGYPRTFMMMDPAYVAVDTVTPTADNLSGRTYSIGGQDATADILHIRYASWPSDAHGHGPLEVAGDRILAAKTFTRYASDLARNGGIPWAVLKHKYRLGAEQAQRVKAQWIKSARERMGAPAILDNDMDLQVLQVLPKDMALSDLQKFTEARIAMMLGVPAFLVSLPSGADTMTYSNVTALFDYHWRATLRPGSRYITKALSAWLLPSGTELELDPTSYVQPTPTERVTYYQGMVSMGAMTADEVRASERMSRLDQTPDTVDTGEVFTHAGS